MQPVMTPAEQPKHEEVVPPTPPALEVQLAKAEPQKTGSPAERALAAWKKVIADREAKMTAAEPPKPEAPTEPKPTEKPAPATEPPVKPPEVPIKPQEPAEQPSMGLARLAKVERQAREAQKAAKEAQVTAEKRVAEMQVKLDAHEKRKTDAKLNPIAWLEEGGLSYEDVSQFQMNGQRPTPELQASKALEEIERLKKSQAEQREASAREEQKRAQAQHEANYKAWQQHIVDFVKSNAAQYELIEQQGAHQLVAQVIQEQYNRNQKVLTEAEAADLVEKHIEEQVAKALATKKLQGKLNPAAPETPKPIAQPGEPTLNNGLTASTPALNGSAKSKDWSSREERARLAMEKARARVS